MLLTVDSVSKDPIWMVPNILKAEQISIIIVDDGKFGSFFI